MSRPITAALVLLAGCGTAATPPPPPSGRAQPITDPVQAAEAAIRDDMPVDYELPFVDRSERRMHRVRMSVTACDAGHKPSCWKALQMAPPAERPAIAKRIEMNCRAGDLLSCRALPASPEQRYAGLPGAAGRSEACEKGTDACDRKAAEAECTAGFPRSCVPLHGTLDRLSSLTAAGCEAWILSECGPYYTDSADDLRRSKKGCELLGWCGMVGNAARDAGNALEERAAYERSCQYDEDGARWKQCIGLGVDYLDHRLPEPVPGRGQALLDWSCYLAEKGLDKGDKITDMLPQCARMTPHR